MFVRSIILLAAMMCSSCASLIKGGFQPVFVGQVPSGGVVLESYGDDIFVHTKDKRVTSKTTFLSALVEDDGSGSSTRDITEELKADTTWIPPKNNTFNLTHSSGGDSVSFKVYCNCSLKDKGRRLHGGSGEVYLEPDCPGGGKPKPKAVEVNTRLDVLWLLVNVPLLGQAMDYFTGALYSYAPVNIARLCSSRKSRR